MMSTKPVINHRPEDAEVVEAVQKVVSGDAYHWYLVQAEALDFASFVFALEDSD